MIGPSNCRGPVIVAVSILLLVTGWRSLQPRPTTDDAIRLTSAQRPAPVPTPTPTPAPSRTSPPSPSPSPPPRANPWWRVGGPAPRDGSDGCRGPLPANSVCTMEYQPVCGCDGVTYPNSCHARVSGVLRVDRFGRCEDPPGPARLPPALHDAIEPPAPAPAPPPPLTPVQRRVAISDGSDGCHGPPAGRYDAACTTEYEPVCGCDGVTYSNWCGARVAGVLRITHSGVCVPDDRPVPYPPPLPPVLPPFVRDSAAVPLPVPLPIPTPPAAAATEKKRGDCYGARIPSGARICTKEYKPVCGCNGVTYSNRSCARWSGVRYFARGKCKPKAK